MADEPIPTEDASSVDRTRRPRRDTQIGRESHPTSLNPPGLLPTEILDPLAKVDRPIAEGPVLLAALDGSAMQAHIGRYRVIRELGRGGFGDVYLAHDDLADRPVAIKVPRRDRLDSKAAITTFLTEARHVSRLKHLGIVALYDCIEQGDRCYLVYEYIDGMSLAQRLRQGPMPHHEAALLVADVADALHYANSQDVFHRDIKPGNILLDKQGRPHVTDFGLAVREEELAGERGRCSGTCPYISPEQVRGEGHRIDGRTDIYSLGVVLYEVLCGRPPFDRKSDDVLEQIQRRDPRPPRQIDDSIPRELERICLKSISKQVTSRYGTAKDMAEDLRLALAPPNAEPTARAETAARRAQTGEPEAAIPRVVPKGLRCFGPEDSDFFLELLPGPRDRNGLPDSIRFWKARIEDPGANGPFPVGLMYGPSGCGKSSLVQAGLLPRLARSIAAVYVEATRDDTETRLRRALCRACPTLDPNLSLAEAFARLRRGEMPPGTEKILIVLDQFEQWLHLQGHDMEKTDLFAALRHADGERVQILLLVRDDFWMSVTRLFEKLEIDLDHGRNARPVDLFDLQHAQHVLRLLGQAHQRLPFLDSELTHEHTIFLNQAVQELSEQGRVISVRLSLFAELMRERPWTLASLVEVGGTAGIGVRFFEETFTSRSALPNHRAVEKPARALLQALLLEPTTDIKGHMRSRAELASACDLREDSPQFARLLQILDHDLRIITPTETESSETFAPNSPTAFYQLTHDYLVPPLRQWLTLERRKTWRGRAAHCLEERAAQMTKWPQSRYLPTPMEFLSITLGVPANHLKIAQRTLMHEAKHHYLLRWGITTIVIVLASLSFWGYSAAARWRSRGQSAEVLVRSALSAPAEDFQDAAADLDPYESLAIPLLEAKLLDMSSEVGPLHRLRAAFALARFQRLDSKVLIGAVASAPSLECGNFITALRQIQVRTAELQQAFREQDDPQTKVRFAILLLHRGESGEGKTAAQILSDPTLRTHLIHHFPDWHGSLGDLPEVLKRGEDGPFRSALCAALGMTRVDAIPPEQRGRLEKTLTWLFLNAPDGGTHSAADWTLRQWGAVPELPPASAGLIDDRRWFVTSNGVTLIEIPPGEFVMHDPDDPDTAHLVRLSRGLFVTDREVSTRLFHLFMEDPDADKPAGFGALDAIGLGPVQVSWFDALLFCNWLSRREHLEPCYEESVVAGERTWECHWDRNGYRLPSEAEWEYACRARAATRFHYGDREDLLDHYAVFHTGGTAPGASKLSNGWGLFDMHGNVLEWCWDRSGKYEIAPVVIDPHGPAAGTKRMCRGGNAASPAQHCYAGLRYVMSPTERNNAGIRLVRQP